MIEKVKEYFEDNYSAKGVKVIDTKSRPGKKHFAEDGSHIATDPTLYDVYFAYKGQRYVVSFRQEQDIDTKFKQRLRELGLEIPD